MTLEQTKLREDVILSRQETPEGASLILKNPDTGRFFRFGAVEQCIIEQLDGQKSLEEIRDGVEQKFGAPLAAATLLRFIENLKRCGLIQHEHGAGERTPKAKRQGRIRGRLLYLRFKVLDPNRLFERMLPYIGFLFTPAFIITSALTILVAFVVAFSNSSEIHQGLRSLYRFDAILLAWIIVTTVTTAHEFAHGLTCKHFGADVHELGFLLIYFQPAFYCNISEAWLLPKKSERLWITFAGAYFELFIWGVAVLTWRVTTPGTVPNFLALIVTATSAVKSFFNMNPLIKLDGYYLLSDYLDIPNLRWRSFRYLGAKIKGWISGIRLSDEIRASLRERRIYLVYGLFAAAYSYWFLSLVIFNVGRWLTHSYQGYGFVAFSSLLMIAFQTPITNVLDRHTKRFQVNRKKVLYVLAAIAVAVSIFGHMELKVASDFKILPLQNAEVRAEIEGILDQIYVDEGDVVKQGQPIARLSDRDLRLESQIADASIAEKQARLRLLLAGNRPEEIELARKAVDTAQTRSEFAQGRYAEATRIRNETISRGKASLARTDEQLKYANRFLETQKTLFREQLIPRQQLEKAEADAAVAQNDREQASAELNMALADELAELKRAVAVAGRELEEARSKLSVLMAGGRPEEIDATRAEIANQTARRTGVLDHLRLVDIVSPISGVVITPKLKDRRGQLVGKGDLIATVHEMRTVNAEIRIPELEIADVKVGQSVILRARAYPQSRFEGQVSSIAPVASADDPTPDSKTVLVWCQIDNPSLALKSEMTGRAQIDIGSRRIIQVMTRRMIRYIRIEFWSWW